MLNVLALILAVAIPPSSSRIVDQANLLTDAEEASLTKSFGEIRSDDGIHLGVLTLSNLDESPKSVAVRTLNDWDMTRRSILILVSTNPRKIWIQPGSDFANALNEHNASKIARSVIAPRLRDGDFFLGVLQGMTASVELLMKSPATIPAPPRADEASGKPVLLWTFLILGGVVLFLGAIYLLVRRSERKKREYDEDEYSYGVTTAPLPAAASTGSIPSTGSGYRARGVVTPAPSTTIVNNGGGGSDLLTGVLIGNAISGHHHHSNPAPSYTPPAPAPSYTPTRTYDNDSSYGGGGSSWDSGGGSSWDSGGGGFDSSGGGGGGSDW